MVTAAVANAAVAVLKLLVAATTHSSAMLAEGIHSIVDTIDEVLLWIGLHRSGRPPDEAHPYGHGKELYFWSMVVAMVVFGVGGGVSIYEGVIRLAAHRHAEHSMWSYAVLGAAAVFEGISWVVSLRTLLRRAGERSLWETIRTSKDPSVYTVFVEDTAALVGLFIAFLGILLSRVLNMPALDSVASILVGLLLACAAVVLIRESRGLLVGESAASDRVRGMCKLAQSDPEVVDVRTPFTMQLGPEAVLVNMEVTFAPELTADKLLAAIDRLDHRIREKFPAVKHLFIEAQRLRR